MTFGSDKLLKYSNWSHVCNPEYRVKQSFTSILKQRLCRFNSLMNPNDYLLLIFASDATVHFSLKNGWQVIHCVLREFIEFFFLHITTGSIQNNDCMTRTKTKWNRGSILLN